MQLIFLLQNVYDNTNDTFNLYKNHIFKSNWYRSLIEICLSYRQLIIGSKELESKDHNFDFNNVNYYSKIDWLKVVAKVIELDDKNYAINLQNLLKVDNISLNKNQNSKRKFVDLK